MTPKLSSYLPIRNFVAPQKGTLIVSSEAETVKDTRYSRQDWPPHIPLLLQTKAPRSPWLPWKNTPTEPQTHLK